MSGTGAGAGSSGAGSSGSQRRALDVLFDLRGIIALLFTVYGIVCIIWGLAFTDSSELARSGGENVNLWAGVVMTVFAGLMWFWAIARPELPPENSADQSAEEPGNTAGRTGSAGRVQG